MAHAGARLTGVSSGTVRPAILLGEGGPVKASQPDLLGCLPSDERERLIRSGHRRRLSRGDMLFRQGDPHDGIALLEGGRIRSFYTAPSGREITLAYWGPGNFIGGPAVFGSGVHVWAAAAVQPSTAILIPGCTLRDLARRVPDAALTIIDALVYKAKCYSALAQILGTRSMLQRLCALLLHLADTHGIARDDGTAITASLTHAELANLIGSTRQWVTVGLARLSDAGAIRQRKGLIVVLRSDVLRRMGAEEYDDRSSRLEEPSRRHGR